VRDWILSQGECVDHFRITRALGRGGMAQVYLARDTNLGRKVALKIVRPEALGSKDAVERFLFEARATARFSHPHIVAVYFVGRHQDKPYVALEYLEGQTLRQRLEQDPPSPQETVRIGLAIAEALQEAHGRRIIHRDLKPENVMLPRDGRLRVVDFGLAKLFDDTGGSDASSGEALPTPPTGSADRSTVDVSFRTHSGVRGTPAYMAPEQWQEREITDATDIWALGVLLHELLFGRRPYDEPSSFKQAMSVCNDTPVTLPRCEGEVPAALARLVGDCLHKEPGNRPGAREVAERLRALLAQDRPRLSTDEGPFRGLLPFGERHAHLFFGRDAEVAAFIERLREQTVLPVVGPSGAGKSSFVQAGVIPRLREKGPLEVIQLRPGARPFETLAARLLAARHPSTQSGEDSPFGVAHDSDAPSRARDEQAVERLAAKLHATPQLLNLELQRLADRHASSVLLFVDQLEELYALVEEEDLRRSFMVAVCTAADDPQERVRVAFTLREEFLSRLADGVGVREALSQITVLRRPGAAALRETLVRPLERVGYSFDHPELVAEMVAEVSGELSCLPLLQFAGQMLWERRDRTGRLLTCAGYEAMGGVAGALARHADGVLAGLRPPEVRLARTMLLRLVTPEGTRRVLPVSRALEGLDPVAEEVLRRLTTSRLVTVRQRGESEAELELAHESLVVTWARLRRWIEESREELAFLEEIGQAAELWARRNRPADEVWRGEALADARRRVEHLSTGVTDTIRSFLQSGVELERRKSRRRRLALVAAITALAALCLVLGLLYHRTLRQRQQAEARRAEALVEGARAALLRDEPLEARAKLRTALELRDTTLARALWWQAQRTPLWWTTKLGGTGGAVSPDGRTVAASGNQAIVLLDLFTRAARFVRGVGATLELAFSPDGQRLVAGGRNGQIFVWDLPREKLSVLRAHTDHLNSLTFSPDGQTLASRSWDRTIRLWDVRAGLPSRPRLTLQVDGGNPQLDFSPDSKLLASGTLSGPILVYDAASGARVFSLEGHRGTVFDVRFSPAGELLASAGRDGTVRVWEVGTRTCRHVLKGHHGSVIDLAFDRSGRKLASAGADRTVRIWDPATGRQLRLLPNHGASVGRISFSTDGRFLACATWVQDRLHLWDLTTRVPETTRGHRAPATALAFGPDGRTVASAGADNTIRLWDVQTGAQRRVLQAPAVALTLGFSPDGKQLVSGHDDNLVRLWNLGEQGRPRALAGHTSSLHVVRVSPDGKMVASSGADGAILYWDLPGGTRRPGPGFSGSAVLDLAFSPDGRLLASAHWNHTIQIRNVQTHATVRVLEGHTRTVRAVSFTRDGKYLMSTSDDGSIRRWEMDTGTSLVLNRQDHSLHSERALALDGLGRPVYVGLIDGTVRAFDLQGRQLDLRHAHRGPLETIQLSPDRSLLATAGVDGAVRLWHADTLRPVWRAPILLEKPARLLTHRGWIRLEEGPTRAEASAWLRALESVGRRARRGGDGSSLCIQTHADELQLWDPVGDRKLASAALEDVVELHALPGACLARTGDGELWLLNRGGKPRALASGITAVAAGPLEILAATDRQVLVLDPASGRRRGAWPGGAGVTSLARHGRWVYLGFGNGTIERLSLDRGGRRTPLSLQDLPTSAVVRILAGPRDTLVLGFAHGAVGLWSPTGGQRLLQIKLHGEPEHLLLVGDTLHAATDLGDHASVDLAVFRRGYCRLLNEVWGKIPVVWEQGRPVKRGPPSGHRCAGSR
jgi:WD40 repeat protein/serine/threonine protein kinase